MIIAGVCRATRLSLIRHDSSRSDVATIETFASVIGPLLHGFVDWIMRTCDEEGIGTSIFSRATGNSHSGCVPGLRVYTANHFAASIYMRRVKLYTFPGLGRSTKRELVIRGRKAIYIEHDSRASCVPVEVVMSAAKPYITVGPDRCIPASERRHLGHVIRDPAFVAALTVSAERTIEPTLAYYRAQGLCSSREYCGSGCWLEWSSAAISRGPAGECWM